MKVTRNWLKQYVEFEASLEELEEWLTMLGVEVEGVERLAGEFEGVVVGQVLASEKHPNADKLSVCKVADGRGERQIVCGAKNYKVGDKVPLALPGCTLPARAGEAPFTIKVAKMRGVESQGMMCSAKELQLSDDAEGLMILAADATVGQPLAEHLGRTAGDVVYDLEITPNRPDLNSVIGIARELSARTGNRLRLPEVRLNETSGESAASWVSVRVEDSELCPRYVARVIRGLKVGPSPDWLRRILESVGLRSINNVVDVTNFVMLETGQPLHAFDYHLLEGKPRPTIVVRRARAGESFVTLDGQKRVLTDEMLLIADETKAVALAGVMGGQNSEINDRTADVLLESAYFKPQNIRATSKKLELRTDASYRFERGGDVGICEWASGRAAQLMVEVAGGELLAGAVDAYPNPEAARVVTLRTGRTSALLGAEVPVEDQAKFLGKLGLELLELNAQENGGALLKARIPSFRVDLKREVDLIEEIARLYGVEKIPSTAPRGAVGSNAHDAIHDQVAEARLILAGLGLDEAQGQTLISEEAARLAMAGRTALGAGANTAGNPSATTDGCVFLANPLSSDMNVLRPSLIPGLLDALRRNVNHKTEDVRLFELGRVFLQTAGQAREERRLAIALTGAVAPRFWSGKDREAVADIFDLKGMLEEFFEVFGLRGVSYAKRSGPDELMVESAVIQLGKQVLGEFGQAQLAVAKRHDLREAVLLAELNFDLILARRNPVKSFKALPAYPSVRRDVAMFVSEEVTHEAVLNAVKQARPANLERVELFDVFRGANLPAGQKSVAYAFTYRGGDRTLTDAEVNAAHEKVVQQLKVQLRAQIRE